MKFIREKKINKWIVIAALYVSFCFAYFVSSRGTVAIMAINYNLPAFLNNDVFAFFIAGVMPLLIYELVTSFAFVSMQRRGNLAAPDMRYALRFFYFLAGIVMGGVNLIFMFYPLGWVYAEIIVGTVVPLIFFVFFMWYALKNYVDKTRYSKCIFELGGTFAVVYGVYAVLGLIMGVLS